MCRGKSFYCLAELLIVVLLLQRTCAETNKQACAPSSCGKITNISYPFRLKDDPAKCGDRRYELACENNNTVLSLFSGKYYVQAINYRNYTIRVVDPGIQESTNCSSIPRYFLSKLNFTTFNYDDDRPYELPDSYYYHHHVIFLSCSKPVKDDGQYVDTASCVNWHSTGHLYAIAGDLSAGKLKVDCHVKLVAISSAFAFNYSFWGDDYDEQNQIHNLAYPEFHKMLAYGFDLSWMVRACEDSCPDKRRCFFNDTTGDLACFLFDYCTSPLGYDVRCENLSKLRIFVEDIIFGIAKGSCLGYERGATWRWFRNNLRGLLKCPRWSSVAVADLSC